MLASCLAVLCCRMVKRLLARQRELLPIITSLLPLPPPACPPPLPACCPAVVEKHRLANGLLFGLPVVLDTDSEDLTAGDRVLLTYQGQVRRHVGADKECWGLRAGAMRWESLG